MLWRVTDKIKDRIRDFAEEMQAETGLSVVEMILILVVIIALVLIFKTQLTTLVNDIFDKITSESAGI
ncbi:MAG: Flp1 family type IVb pilin [Eubacteriales bacterium]|nr:Flp1 family type IVb pilin [Eubacteriales bacterium]